MLGELIISTIVVGCIVKSLGNRSSGCSLKNKRVCHKCGNIVNRIYDEKFHCKRC